MVKHTNFTFKPLQAAYEKDWIVGFSTYVADREFKRMRRKAFIKKAAGVITGRKSGSPEPALATRTRDGLLVPIDSIIGSVDRHGRKVLRLPMMSRALLGEWRRLFAADLEDAYPKLAVRPGPGGWYLTGGAPALIALEVLRAKKIGMVRVVADQGMEAEPCCGSSETDAADECCGELPEIAS